MLNRTGRSPIRNKTSYELWFNEQPEVNHFRIFGTDVYVHIPKEKRKKWNPKSKKGIFVGYCDDTKGYRIWLPEIMVARDVIFKEEILRHAERLPSVEKFKKSTTVAVSDENNSADESESEHNADVSTIDLVTDSSDESFSTTHSDDPTWLPSENDESDSIHQSFVSELFTMAMGSAFVTEYNKPSSLESALVSPDSGKWIDAMDDEFKSLEENNTWDLVELPSSRKVIDNRWVFKLKLKPTGEIDRHKPE